MIKPACFCATALLLSVVSGCSGGSTLDTVPAAAVVTMNGDPIEDVQVTLVPQKGVAGRGGYGKTDTQGQVTLRTDAQTEGVPPGKYRVLFQRLRMPDGGPIPDGAMAADVGAANDLPPVYNNPNQTPVLAVIPDSGDTSMAFELRSRAR